MFPIRSLNTKLELELTWHFFPCLRLAAGGGDGLMLQLGMSHCLRSWREGGNDDFLMDNHNSQHDYRLSGVGMSFLSTWGLDEAEGCLLWLTWTTALLTSGWGADGKMASDLAYTSKVTSERVPIFFLRVPLACWTNRCSIGLESCWGAHQLLEMLGMPSTVLSCCSWSGRFCIPRGAQCVVREGRQSACLLACCLQACGWWCFIR